MISPETHMQIRRYFYAEHWKMLEAAGEGAILAGQAEPHCECSMAVSGDGMA